MKKVFDAVLKLERQRIDWVSREILTLDFSEGAQTWLERTTLDVDLQSLDLVGEPTEHIWPPTAPQALANLSKFSPGHSMKNWDCESECVRHLAYVQPNIGENQWGNPSINY